MARSIDGEIRAQAWGGAAPTITEVALAPATRHAISMYLAPVAVAYSSRTHAPAAASDAEPVVSSQGRHVAVTLTRVVSDAESRPVAHRLLTLAGGEVQISEELALRAPEDGGRGARVARDQMPPGRVGHRSPGGDADPVPARRGGCGATQPREPTAGRTSGPSLARGRRRFTRRGHGRPEIGPAPERREGEGDESERGRPRGCRPHRWGRRCCRCRGRRR